MSPDALSASGLSPVKRRAAGRFWSVDLYRRPPSVAVRICQHHQVGFLAALVLAGLLVRQSRIVSYPSAGFSGSVAPRKVAFPTAGAGFTTP